VSPEELYSQLRFERPYALTHGSGGDAELGGGAREIAVSDAGGQNTQRVQRRHSLAHDSFEVHLQMKVNFYRYPVAATVATL
jgi:uncharacterized protein YfaP (DUF2135 family)